MVTNLIFLSCLPVQLNFSREYSSCPVEPEGVRFGGKEVDDVASCVLTVVTGCDSHHH